MLQPVAYIGHPQFVQILVMISYSLGMGQFSVFLINLLVDL